MIALIRLILLIVLLEGLFYLLLTVYIRSLRRERLEGEWDARHPDQAGDTAAREEFVDRAMVRFKKSLQSRLVLLVFVVPTLVIMGIIYYVNWQ